MAWGENKIGWYIFFVTYKESFTYIKQLSHTKRSNSRGKMKSKLAEKKVYLFTLL